MRTGALYLRVSTLEQTTENQRRELETVAQRHGWTIVAVFEDAGISGAKGREQRPAFNRLLQGIARKDFDIVLAWSVDRLGRSLKNLVGFLEDLQAKGVDLYLHQQGLDSSTSAGKAMFQMCGVFAEYERAILVERIRAGLSRARAAGVRLGPKPKEVDLVLANALLSEGKSIRAAGRSMNIKPETLRRHLRAAAGAASQGVAS